MSNTAGNKKQKLLTLPEHLSSHRFVGGVRAAHRFRSLCCPTMCVCVLDSVLWCPLRFPHTTMFGSSLPPVVCRSVLFMLFVFVCVQWCLTHVVLCFWFCWSSSYVPCVSGLSGLYFF